MTYPVPEKRHYKDLIPYRGYFVGVYIDTTKPATDVGCPSYQHYFPVDDLGDPILPVDVPFWSPVLAMSAIDVHIMLGEDKTAYRRTGSPWAAMHQNYRLQRCLPALANALRRVNQLVTDPKIDVRYMDADDLADAIKAELAPIWKALDTAGRYPGDLDKQELDDDLVGG